MSPVTIALTSDNAALEIPSTVSIPADRAAAGFAIGSSAVGAVTTVNGTATLGTNRVTATVVLRPPAPDRDGISTGVVVEPPRSGEPVTMWPRGAASAR